MELGELVAGRFRLVERVGAGGMGVVFRAIDEHTRAAVAVKLLDARTGEQIERARREAAILSRLSHPAIVRHVADGVLADGSLFVAMEWIDGVTVAHRIANLGFKLREAVEVVRGITEALASAHQAGVLHRDLKPSNIVLALAEAPKLIDFGIARVDAALALTRTGAAIGTPGYMSPEQARGERALTPAADVFGLGCVLYECATGKPAFSGSAAAAVMTKILFAEPAPLGDACPEAPLALMALVDRMLAKDPRRRLADCAAVLVDIAALGGLPDGPRRNARPFTMAPTQVPRPPGAMHCMIAAGRGNLDDVLEPPSPEQCAELARIAGDEQLEILATGVVVIHVVGNASDAARRAAIVALDMQRILAGWAIAVSANTADAAIAIDEGTALLTQATMALIFRRSVIGIAIDRSIAALLGADFEVVDGPRLVGLRR